MAQQQKQRHEVSGNKVSCDGGGGQLGHPKVYLHLDGKNEIECPYCGKLFVLKEA